MFKAGTIYTRQKLSLPSTAVRNSSASRISINTESQKFKSRKAFTTFQILLLIVFLLTIAILIGHHFLMRTLKDLDPKTAAVPSTHIAAPTAQTILHVTRRSFLEPGRKFYLNTIFAKDQKIAEFKSDGDKIFDLSGSIPDGKVEFQNLSQQSRGYEYFQNNIRQGEFKEYHANGNIWFEKSYKDGNMITIVEYLNSGVLRMKADYSDTLQTCESKDNGVGIVYHSNGKPMYEWHLTAIDERRFKKFYDSEGHHQMTQYFDNKGHLINSENHQPSSTEM